MKTPKLVNGKYEFHHPSSEEIIALVNEKLSKQNKFLRSDQVTALIEVLVEVLNTHAFKQHPAAGLSEYPV